VCRSACAAHGASVRWILTPRSGARLPAEGRD
jgi:hypothetical protein